MVGRLRSRLRSILLLSFPTPKRSSCSHPNTLVAKMLTGSRQLTYPNLGPTFLTWSTNGWLFSSTVGLAESGGLRCPGESQARVLPKLRLPKFTLVNEDPSLIAL